MADTFCALCGQVFAEGELRYIVRIKIMSDFDGVIPSPDEDPSEEIQRLLEDMEGKEAQELEDDVYQELSVYMCLHCKKRFTKGLIKGKEDELHSHKKHDTIYH